MTKEEIINTIEECKVTYDSNCTDREARRARFRCDSMMFHAIKDGSVTLEWAESTMLKYPTVFRVCPNAITRYQCWKAGTGCA